MIEKCAKEKAAVEAVQRKLHTLHDEVNNSSGAQKKEFLRQQHLAEVEALELQRKLNLCLG